MAPMAGWGDDPVLEELRSLLDTGWEPVRASIGSGSDALDRVWVKQGEETRELSSDHIAFHRFVEGLREDHPDLPT
jgi:hypothetical protein